MKLLNTTGPLNDERVTVFPSVDVICIGYVVYEEDIQGALLSSE